MRSSLLPQCAYRANTPVVHLSAKTNRKLSSHKIQSAKHKLARPELNHATDNTCLQMVTRGKHLTSCISLTFGLTTTRFQTINQHQSRVTIKIWFEISKSNDTMISGFVIVLSRSSIAMANAIKHINHNHKPLIASKCRWWADTLKSRKGFWPSTV